MKLVATRDQGFTVSSHRAETKHHIKLGATRDGRLNAPYCVLTMGYGPRPHAPYGAIL